MAKGSPTIAGAEDLRARASARYVRLAPRKVRRVVDLIRGMEAQEALSVLQFAPQAASEQVAKVLASAVANAEHNLQLDPESLIVAVAYVDEGPGITRFRPRAQGRAFRINKRTSHITIEVEAVLPVAPARKAAGPAKKAAAAKAGPAKAGPAKAGPAKAGPAKAPAEKAPAKDSPAKAGTATTSEPAPETAEPEEVTETVPTEAAATEAAAAEAAAAEAAAETAATEAAATEAAATDETPVAEPTPVTDETDTEEGTR